MTQKYELDILDRSILSTLLQDARKPFTEIAKAQVVSTGTIHQRVEKMKAAGVIQGFHVDLDQNLIGKPVTVLIGIHVNSAKDIPAVYDAMKDFKEIIEVHFTTGTYALIAKVVSESVQEFHRFLTQELQTLEPIRATETFFCLSTPIKRHIEP